MFGAIRFVLISCVVSLVMSSPARASHFVMNPPPFISQAPFGNWADPWQDFCEEASIVMVAHAVKKLPLTPNMADREMRIIKSFEEVVFRRHRDTSIEETMLTLQLLYGLSGLHIKTITTAEGIKHELREGRLIIAPVAGRLLKNPYFKSPGPLYHMVVIHDFDDNRNIFITHDPGTRRGANFPYQQQVMLNAVHDWNKGDVLRGAKKILVVDRI